MARIEFALSPAGKPVSRRAAGRSARWRFAPLALVAVLSACSFTPEYLRPASPVAEQWPIPPMGAGVDPAAILAGMPAANIGWRQFFNDTRLQELISLSLENNRDLRIAMLNIEAARAQFNIQRSALSPSLGVAGAGTRQRVPGDLAFGGDSMISSQYQVGVAMPAFEIDLFGRLRSLSESALAQYLSTEESRRNVQITLISQVAETYLNLLASNAQIELTERTLKSRQESYNLVKRRFDAGVGSALELNQSQTLLDAARSDRQAMLRARAQAMNALTLLTGTATLPDLGTSAQPFARNDLLAPIPAGLSSEVLLLRPDVLAAEQRLLSANANIGAARSAFFPTIS
nr:efflux transporter outer membrane subunit [Pseudomonas sp.]